MCVYIHVYAWKLKARHGALCLIWEKWARLGGVSAWVLTHAFSTQAKTHKLRGDGTFNLSRMLCQAWCMSLYCRSLKSIQGVFLCLPPVPQRCDQALSVCYCCRRHMGPQWIVNLLASLCPLPVYVCVGVCVGDRWTEANRKIHCLMWREKRESFIICSSTEVLYLEAIVHFGLLPK